jgi:hypothetical protein
MDREKNSLQRSITFLFQIHKTWQLITKKRPQFTDND